MRKLLLFVLISQISIAQNIQYDELADKFGKQHLSTLLEYISIPCDANFKEDIMRNYAWVEGQFAKRGFETKKLETSTLPVLLLEKKSKKPNSKTILFYYHSDGQPVVPKDWSQADPFVPVLKKKNLQTDIWEEIPMESLKKEIDPEWRIFARASADDKGPGVMLMAALDALASQNIETSYNLKILVDFEEEKGSVSLPSIIDKYKTDLTSDLLLIFDGPAHASNLPTLTFGARGIATVTLTTYGAYTPQHSGHYGNYLPNPALKMAQLLASMKSETGKVLIPGFYDGVVLDKKTKDKLKEVPDDLLALNKKLGFKKPDNVGDTYQESLIYPSLNIRGLKSGEVGALAATIIPDKAVAEIDIRTVEATDPAKLVKNVKDFIVSKGYTILENDPTPEEREKYEKIIKLSSRPAYGAFNTDMNGEIGLWLEKALSKTTTKKIIKLPGMGGSVPISPFVTKLGVKAVIVPTVNADNNQHSANENLRLGNYFDGIKTMMGLLSSEF
ncbi:M20/M25/M40 family metallo-hydrolase [Lacihabitans sp. LS3-19]|uniref:M20/M25/M40 family metallo-hydrolase n=1 Tax=Lacihabitans sp. LS3-19 TaxID=2487335 RepID=UPI0020CE4AD5|nr:M20/M25/M40 family metallo-hydrolase [Lacihabitans sp. LS3-19]MCP9770789.1 M20/M25/M40 family metallo-hydrolase [Lacihabitans sp. LS3-19]